MLKAQLIERVAELEAELAAAKAAPAELEATVMFGIRNLQTNQTHWMAKENLTREEAERFAREHAQRIGTRFEVTFYPKNGTERERA
jgi:hypothetical protein